MALSKEEIQLAYGKNATVSRKSGFALIHLDRPTTKVMRARTRDFKASTFFDDNCPVCKLQKEGGVVVYDDSPIESDDEESAESC